MDVNGATQNMIMCSLLGFGPQFSRIVLGEIHKKKEKKEKKAKRQLKQQVLQKSGLCWLVYASA